MKLNKNILIKIDKVIDDYLANKINLDEELKNKIFSDNKKYIESGDFLSDYFIEAINLKNSNMIDNAFILFYDNPNRYVYNKNIVDSINKLLLENWHSFQEKAIYTIIMYLQDISSITYLEKAAVWDDECIEFFEDGFHKDAIRGIFQIAKKDSIQILENLVGKVDEETAPFLERKIKEAKEMYLNS